MSGSRIYLDHAATTWPKAECVIEAMSGYARECGTAAGRGAYRSAQQASEIVAETRRRLAQLIAAESGKCISLQASGTAALNVAIHGIGLRAGDHVVTTAAEHNSVLRPLHHLVETIGIQVTTVACDQNGFVHSGQILQSIRKDTRLVAMTHASNVTGAIQPIVDVGEVLREHPALLLCDAAQSLGYLPIDARQLGVDLLAAPGHKGLGGPMGTGILYVSPNVQQNMRPLLQGGTGSQSESLMMPEAFPSKLESGNLNVPAIAGLLAGLQSQVEESSLAELSSQLHKGLSEIDGLKIFGSCGAIPIASVAIPGLSPADLAAILDTEFGIETRSGFHCAALIHQYLGSADEGTLRISAGHSTTADEIAAVLNALREICKEFNG